MLSCDRVIDLLHFSGQDHSHACFLQERHKPKLLLFCQQKTEAKQAVSLLILFNYLG